MYFWQKNEGVILDDGNFDGTKSSQHPCLTLRGRMVSYLISVLRKISYKLEKMENYRKTFSITFFAQKNSQRKNFRRHF